MRSSKKYGRLTWFVVLTALAALVLAGQVRTAPKPGRAVLYAAAGPELMQFDVGTEGASLVKRGSVTLPDNVQEARPDPSGKFLYVTWSNGVTGSTVPPGRKSPHGVSAFRIDPATGALHSHGDPISLAARSVFITTDMDGTHLVVAYNDPSGITVHTLKPDGTLGSPVPRAGPIDVGIYAHQVRMDPSNQAVILVTRGNAPAAGKPEDPGAIKIFNYKNGVLSNRSSIAPDGGFNFQVRHLDFHPSGRWDFVTLERQNKLYVFRRAPDGTLSDRPLFMKDSLAKPGDGSGQALSTIHVHPNGRFVYLANRASGMVDFEGKRVFAGGENTIAVFSINQETGEPALIQNADTHGMHPRTFSLDASGRVLVVANMMAVPVRTEKGVSVQPACLSVFRVGNDGMLDFVRKYDIETGGTRSLFWTGFVSLP
jgi:6-phosphogluconolactonase (cycloisomerase 2 family)